MARRSKPEESVGIDELFRRMGDAVAQQSVKPNIAGYVPHAKQLEFHKGKEHLRAYFGGNRSGKTYSAVVEDIWTCSKTHPYKPPIPGQVRGRVVGVDFKDGVDQILVPLFKQLMLPSMLVNSRWEDSYQDSKHLLTFSNGSIIEFMSYEQEVEKFAGTSRHFIHYDEEPPKDIYNECQARLVDTEGDSWLSMTPLKGATWVFEDVYEKVMEAEDKEVLLEGTFDIAPITRSLSEEVLIIEVGMNENPHISAKARERYLSKLDGDEKAARGKGTFMTMGGRVFKGFSKDSHVISTTVIPSELQRAGWQIYTSVDHGWANPTAWLWHAVEPGALGGRIITFGEHYKSEMTIADHAMHVHLKEQTWGLDTSEIIRVGDPAMNQKSGLTGASVVDEYQKHDIFIITEGIIKERSLAIPRMQEYLRVHPNKSPMWQIAVECVNFIRELGKLKWDQHATSRGREGLNKKETVKKKDDHAFDSAKYFATFLPDLTPGAPKMENPKPPVSDGIVSYDDALIAALNSAEEKAAAAGWEIEEGYDY